MTNSAKLSEDQVASLSIKLICEPRDITYNGPKTQSSGLGIFGGFQHRVESKTDTGVKTSSHTIGTISFRKAEEVTPEIVANLRIQNSFLNDFKNLVTDPALEQKIQLFHKTYQSLLDKLAKKQVSAQDVQQIVQAMKPYNLGIVYKLQLVVTKISRENFPKSLRVPETGLYHRTVKSKQAYMPYTDTIDDTVSRVQELLTTYRGQQNQDSVMGNYTYVVETVTGSKGSYKRLVSENTNLYESKQ